MITGRTTDGEQYDAIVIGAGPAGSTAAYSLASQGHSVLLLERAQFPRFHIGESLVPYSVPLFQRMGIFDTLQQRGGQFIIKPGVEVTEANTSTVRRAPFFLMAEGQAKFAFNVERAEFDELLFSTAAGAGAKALQQAEVKQFLSEGDRITGVQYEHNGQVQTARSRFVVDASGRAGLIANKFNLRRMNQRLRNVAIFQH